MTSARTANVLIFGNQCRKKLNLLDFHNGKQTFPIDKIECEFDVDARFASMHVRGGALGVECFAYFRRSVFAVTAVGSYTRSNASSTSQTFGALFSLDGTNWNTTWLGYDSSNSKNTFELKDDMNYVSGNRSETLDRKVSGTSNSTNKTAWTMIGGQRATIFSSTSYSDNRDHHHKTFNDTGTWNITAETTSKTELSSSSKTLGSITTSSYHNELSSNGTRKENYPGQYTTNSASNVTMTRTDPTAAFTVSNTNSMTVTREEGYTGYVPANIPETTTNTYSGSIAINDSWGSASTPGISALGLVSLTFGANGVGVGIPANVDSYAGGSLADQNFDDFIPRPPQPPMDTSDVSGPIDPTWWNTIGAMASEGFQAFDHHASLDALGLIPGAGEAMDGLNGILYTLEGDMANAVISFGAMVPVVGDAGKAGKYVNKGAKHFGAEALENTAQHMMQHSDDVLDAGKTGAYFEKNGRFYQDIPYDASKGTGRAPINLREQLAIETVKKNPALAEKIDLTMTDPRWNANDGWVKMRANIEGVEVHFVMQRPTGIMADFKIK